MLQLISIDLDFNKFIGIYLKFRSCQMYLLTSQNAFHVEFVHFFTSYQHTRFRTHSYNVVLIIVIKRKVVFTFHVPTKIGLIQSNYKCNAAFFYTFCSSVTTDNFITAIKMSVFGLHIIYLLGPPISWLLLDVGNQNGVK
jgi:hypothetical protein